MPISFSRLVFVDLETGGLDPNGQQIIQNGAVDSRLRELEAFERKIRFHHRGISKKPLSKNSFEEGERESVSEKEAAIDFAEFL